MSIEQDDCLEHGDAICIEHGTVYITKVKMPVKSLGGVREVPGYQISQLTIKHGRADDPPFEDVVEIGEPVQSFQTALIAAIKLYAETLAKNLL